MYTVLRLLIVHACVALLVCTLPVPVTHARTDLQPPTGSASNKALWTEAVDLGGGWKWLDWFGYFNTSHDPWVYHAQHAWMYAVGDIASNIYLYSTDLGWLWTGQNFYPWMYRFSGSDWIWYLPGSSGPRWFYNGTTGLWENDDAGAAYYVSAAGSDDADGLSPSTAFLTINKALSVVRPGESVYILPGEYNESMEINGLGDGTATISVKGVPGLTVLDGQNTLTFSLFCEQCAGLVFDDLILRDYTDIGIAVGMSSDITFRDLKVYDNGAAVQLVGWELEGYGIHVENSSDVLIEANEVYRNGPNPPVFPDRLLGTGINTYAITNGVIRNNRSYANHGGGILVEDSVNVLVEGNTVFSNDLDATVDEWWDGGLWLDGGRDVTVRGNVFRHNLGPGIEISDEDDQNPTGYVLEGNVSTGNYFGIYIWNFGTAGWPDPSILSRTNNDFSGNSRGDVWIQP
ncbi:right-handed parallel beta-helix repeat-containing protein [Verrucomicrobiota bacterium]